MFLFIQVSSPIPLSCSPSLPYPFSYRCLPHPLLHLSPLHHPATSQPSPSPSSSPPLSLPPASRCAPTGPPATAPTCCLTGAAWPCWWWASCSSPPCWCWPWPPTAAWPATSSWASASSPTAAPSTRTCPPRSTAAWPPAAAARGGARGGALPAGRGRCGCSVVEVREGVGGGTISFQSGATFQSGPRATFCGPGAKVAPELNLSFCIFCLLVSSLNLQKTSLCEGQSRLYGSSHSL